MLKVNNLTIELVKNSRQIISDLSFTVHAGDKIAIIGEEGNGKSTLLKAIYQQETISSYCKINGNINKGNKKVGYVAQILEEKDKHKTIEEYMLSNDNDELDYNFYKEIYSQQPLFLAFGLDGEIITKNRQMISLSGGERIKLAIIKLLLHNPDLILLDEPTNDLDLDSLEFLEEFIITTDIPIIFISHDETLLEKTANMIIHLEQINRKTKAISNVAKLTYKEYVTQRFGMIEKNTEIAKTQRRKYQEQKEILNQQYNKVHHQLETITRADPAGARLLKKKMKSIKSHEQRFERERREFLAIPNVEEAIKFCFSNEIYVPTNKEIINLYLPELKIKGKVLSENISLNISGPKHIVIIGKNGSGKTTLLGEIYNILKIREDLRIEYMPQFYDDLFERETEAYKFVSKSSANDDIAKARTIMGSMKFTADEMTTKIKNLSGGQKAKLYLIKMILNNPHVLILDEPTRNLSPLSNPVIRGVLANYNGAIISVSHDRKYIEEVCDVVYNFTKDGLELIDFFKEPK